MSYDELPPDPVPSPQIDERTTEATRELSSSDAPPVPPTRRRRARGTGTAAASEDIAPVAEEPARTTRKRTLTTRTQIASEPPDETVLTETETPSVPDAPFPAPPVPAPVRRTRKKKEPVPEIVAECASLTEPAPESVAHEENAPAVSPRKPARGGRKRKTETVETPAPEASIEATPREAQAVADPVPAPEEEVAPAASDTPEMPPIEVVAPETERPAHSRRTRRKPVATESPASELLSEPVPSEENRDTVAAPESAEADASAEADDTQPASRSRRRRERRSRRNRSGSAVEIGADTSELAEVDLVPAGLSPGLLEIAPVREVVVEPEPIIDRSVGAHLITRHGIPEIHINGNVIAPVLFFGNMQGRDNRQRVLSQVRRAARVGIHLHSTLVELPCPLTEASDALDVVTDHIRAVLEADPEGYVMPRLVFTPARGWRREYPTDIATYSDGTTGDPSLTSERFWLEAEHSLAMLIAHVRNHSWGQRIFGYHLERGEWFQMAQQGYDRSMANRDAFRDWLREKYRHNLVALRAAWHDGNVQFHTAEIPPVQTKPNPNRAFYETRRERRYIDFNEFTSQTTARRLMALAKAVKRASDYQALVSVCYGYTFEFGHPFSGHLALGELLTSPHIDLICGPPSYRDRKPGGAASFPAPVASPALHGKLWLTEDDTKTYLAPSLPNTEDFNPRMGDRMLTEQAHLRALGRVMAHNTAIGFMDLWGEGWLDEESLWDKIGAVIQMYNASRQKLSRQATPDVVALIDEQSLLHIQRGEHFFRKISNGLRDVLQRAGVSYGKYLQSDVLAPDFPTDAKLYLFLTPYRLTSEQRAAIKEKLQNGGKTLAWLYAPGSCEERPGPGGGMEEAVTDAVGLILRHQEWNSEIGSRVIEPYHPLTERLNGREIGTRERLNPSFYVDDPEATVLAEYQGSGLPSIAARDFGSWKSVFIGEPCLPLELLRGLCRYAGVHAWINQGEDVVSVGNGWVMVHTSRDGHRVLRLPEATCLYDLAEHRLISTGTVEYRYFQRSGTTRLFRVGTLAELQALGFTERAAAPPPPRARPEPEPPVAPAPPISTPIPAPLAARYPSLEDAPESIREDLETLAAVLSMNLDELEATDIAKETVDPTLLNATVASLNPLTTEPDGNGRRRRRRGGRGRGRRRFEVPADGAQETDAPGEGEVSAALEPERESALPPFFDPDDDFPAAL